MQFFKENGEKCKEDVSSIRAIGLVLSGKKVSLVCVLFLHFYCEQKPSVNLQQSFSSILELYKTL